MSLFSCIGRPFIFMIDPEHAHGLALTALKTGINLNMPVSSKKLEIQCAGLSFPNPIGMAAGFDKNAEVTKELLNMGFGHSEIGTVTPKKQDGNPRPRLFRLVEDEAVINRMGFNNDGHDAVYNRLHARLRNGIIGVNIGANKDSENRILDYSQGITRFYAVADYFTINISSPNTPGLRDLQAKNNLEMLLQDISKARQDAAKKHKKHVPVFLKIAPDLDEQGLDDIATAMLASDFDGMIISNTTLARHQLKDQKHAAESGGLSGKPLFAPSTIILAKMRQRLGPKMPIIGVGGIMDGADLIEKIKAGADLAQLYSAMVYYGPNIANIILKQALSAMGKDGVGHIADYRDQSLAKWAEQKIML